MTQCSSLQKLHLWVKVSVLATMLIIGRVFTWYHICAKVCSITHNCLTELVLLII